MVDVSREAANTMTFYERDHVVFQGREIVWQRGHSDSHIVCLTAISRQPSAVRKTGAGTIPNVVRSLSFRTTWLPVIPNHFSGEESAFPVQLGKADSSYSKVLELTAGKGYCWLLTAESFFLLN
jgi:hypothetical protein